MYLHINTGNPDKIVSLIGSINTINKTQTIQQGYNMIGTPYPMAVALTNSGLASSGLAAGAMEFAASTINAPNASGGLDIAWLHSSGAWYDTGTTTASTIRLKPGVGYYLFDTDVANPAPSFTWTYPKPY